VIGEDPQARAAGLASRDDNHMGAASNELARDPHDVRFDSSD
jgi:hypothetical protein